MNDGTLGQMGKAPLLTVDDLAVHYRTRFGQQVHAVKGVSFTLDEGTVFGIAGESGCGKSTLVNGVMGLFIPPLFYTRGSVVVDGEDITKYDTEKLRVEVLGKKISMIPQGALNSLNPTRKVKKFATDVMKNHEPGLSKSEIYDRLEERFKAIGLDPRVLNMYPLELSGGMKQRVVIGISTLMNPQVVIADEPTSALDVSTQKSVIKMLLDLMERKIFGSMIFITHELPLLYHVADSIAVMYDGKFVEVGGCDQVINRPVHEYSKQLMNAITKLSPSGERRGSAGGPG
jgi:peptide/nickel transport system ATP-binding protein